VVCRRSPSHLLLLVVVAAAARSLHCRSTRDPPHEQLLVRLGVGDVASFVVVLPCCCCLSSSLPFHPRSTPRAVARGAGGRWCVARRVVLVLGSLVAVPVVPIGGGGVTWPVAPEPPCEQVLAGMGGGCWCSPSLVSLAPRHGTHLQTTLRAAAHRRGGGRRVVPGCWGPRRRRPVVVTWPLAPTIHPASSGSQRWWRVLCWLCCVAVVDGSVGVVGG
jgi:hypothetical protein